ncbi:PDZ domain-containing protein [candidate division WOR-3 bacterium]|nr:PDZ domain-containing protein [candidate division WOR-3 bacterium]
MRDLIKVRIAAWMIVCLGAVQYGYAQSKADEQLDSAIVIMKPALVRLHVVAVYDDQGREQKHESAGSGAIITPEGHVITNHHVAGRAKRIVCTLANKEEIEAELIGTDPLADIAVVKLMPEQKRDFPYALFGDSDILQVGDPVYAMGSPLALSQSVTRGIVSNTEMVMPEMFWPFQFRLEGEDVGSIVRWIGHDASIFPGNSGGPLVNLQGNIIGINEISFGIAGAIPGNLARKIAFELIENGAVARAWFGLEIQPLLKLGDADEGALVSGTIEHSPAHQAGFRPGDILTYFNGQAINVRFAEELPILNQMMMDCEVGTPVQAIVRRNGKEITVHVTPVEREYVLPKTIEVKDWGITARNISLFLAKEMKRDDQDGVLVTSVRPSGPAGEAKPPLSSGDVIVNASGRSIKDIDDLKRVSDALTEFVEEPVSVLVEFERNDEHQITVVKLGKRDSGSHGQQLRKAWLGIAYQVLTRDIANALDLDETRGIRITQIFDDTPAEKAGLRVGDIITAIDDLPVEAQEIADIEVFTVMIRQFDIGSAVTLDVIRNKKKTEIPVTLTTSPRPPAEMDKYVDMNFEFTVRDIAFMDRVEQRLDADAHGVLVADVVSGSWAALAHLAANDLIVAVNSKTVDGVETFRSLMERISAQRSEKVIMQIQRGIHSFFTEIEPDWE